MPPVGYASASTAPPVEPARPAALTRRDPVADLDEKVRTLTAAGKVNWLPWLDPYTEETAAMRRMYPVMLRNPVVKQSLQHKVHATASLDLLVVPAAETPRDHEVADFVRYQYADAYEGGFPALAEELLFPALIWKATIAEKVWYPELWDRGKFSGKLFWRTFKAKENSEPLYDEFRNLTGIRSHGYGQAEVYEPADFIVLKNWPLFQGPGMSDLRAAYGYLWQLDTIEKLRMIHLERYLSPVLWASYDEAGGFNVAELPNLDKDLSAVRARGWFRAPKSVQITSLQLATRGEAEFLATCKDLREQITLSITGAYLQMLTATSGGDIRGNSRVQQSTSELLVWELAARLAGVLNTQATPMLVRTNYQGADYPKVTLGGISYDEMLKGIKIDEAAQKMGVKLSARSTARKYSLQLAADASDVLHPVMPAGPGGGGGAPAQQQPDAGGVDDGQDGTQFADPDPESIYREQSTAADPGASYRAAREAVRAALARRA